MQRKKYLFFYFIGLVVILPYCKNFGKEDEKREKLSNGYSYLLSPAVEDNFIKQNGVTVDVKGFRNIVFTKSYEEYTALIPEDENLYKVVTDSSENKFLNTKYNEIFLYENDLLKKYPLNGAVCSVNLIFLDRELAQIDISAYMKNSTGHFIFDDNDKMINFFTSAYGYNFKNGICEAVRCRSWIFPTTTIEYLYTNINFHLLLTLNDKKELLEKVVAERDKLSHEKREKDEVEKLTGELDENKRREREKIKKEL